MYIDLEFVLKFSFPGTVASSYTPVVELYNKNALEIITNKAGFKVNYISSINRIDSFYAALIHAGNNPKNLKFILRLIMFPIQPFLKIFNLAPEILCIISKK